MRFAKNKLFNAAAFNLELKNSKNNISVYKNAIKSALEQLKQAQNQGISASDIVHKYAWFIDQLVSKAWQDIMQAVPESDFSLVAVGGYGRNELHPYSDVDLLILSSSDNYHDYKDQLEAYIRFLWDIGLDVGHSIRSVKECIKESNKDITIMTNLLEARHLTGNEKLLIKVDEKIRASRTWSTDKFFEGKFSEQMERYSKYSETSYQLEPNLKDGLGGLRDLQTILWVYNRRYGTRTFREMNEQGFIDDEEYRILIRGRNILWRMRTGLHLTANRREDRLLFDYQRALAESFGYQDDQNHLAVEQLMKRFYRTVKDVLYLNEVLLENYRILNGKKKLLNSPKLLDDHFQLRNKMIEMRTDDVFEKDPINILQLFILMQEHRIIAIHPDTIRAIRANLTLINHEFRNSEKAKSLFIKLVSHDGIRVANALARMNSYGVLGAYIPAFGAIVGQMQHDLFHVYTVDGHTLIVISNITRLRKYPDEFPVASKLFNNLYKPERLILAALFHDIAKGRGGDHSELGALDAYDFCIDHGLSEYDAKLVSWLVERHLFMSHFSQRRDISDPEVVAEFAQLVGDIEYLENLYILTLADIRGTSPKVWNAWKGQLLLDLYNSTRQALRRGVAEPLQLEEHIKDDKKEALQLLEGSRFNQERVEEFWDTLSSDYFIRNEPYYIAWHAKSLSSSSALDIPIVSIRYSERLEANMFFIYAPDSSNLLTDVTGAFDSLELNIIEARLQKTTTGFSLYSFNATLPHLDEAKSQQYMKALEKKLRSLILQGNLGKQVQRRNASRVLKHFPIKTKVSFSLHTDTYTVMDVYAQDQPGLLHNVAIILNTLDLRLVNAKVATFGERAEDVFFIQTLSGEPVEDENKLAALEQQICEALDNQPKHNTSVINF
jgi:[protein-PII] uridylyltransferase